MNVPQGETAPASAKLTLTLTVPDGFGCDGTIVNGSSVIPASDGITVYEIEPQDSITLNLHWYNRQNYVTLTFLNTNDPGEFFMRKYPAGNNAPSAGFEVPTCPYTHSSGVFDYWTTTVDGASKDYFSWDIAPVPQEDTVFSPVWQDVRFISFYKTRSSAKGVMEKQAATSLNAGPAQDPNNPGDAQNRYIAYLTPCAFTCDGYVFTGWKDSAGNSYEDRAGPRTGPARRRGGGGADQRH